tara:strand:- start:46 stop:441 length:396 start_codon:yes stop_codon:yes gene_type:complete
MMSFVNKSFYLLLFLLIFLSCKKQNLTKENWHITSVSVDGQDYTDVYRSSVIDESINFEKKKKKYVERINYTTGEEIVEGTWEFLNKKKRIKIIKGGFEVIWDLNLDKGWMSLSRLDETSGFSYAIVYRNN